MKQRFFFNGINVRCNGAFINMRIQHAILVLSHSTDAKFAVRQHTVMLTQSTLKRVLIALNIKISFSHDSTISKFLRKLKKKERNDTIQKNSVKFIMTLFFKFLAKR